MEDSLNLSIDSMETIAEIDQTKSTGLVNINFIEFLMQNGIELAIAVGAIITAIYAVRSYNRNRLSRRAHVLPETHVGYLIIRDEIFSESSPDGLLITLKNFGINPAHELKAVLSAYNRTGGGIFRTNFHTFNPVAQNVQWVINIPSNALQNVGIGSVMTLLVNYLIMEIQYFDRNQSRQFEGKFYWSINDEGQIVEPDVDGFNIMRQHETTDEWIVQIPLPEIRFSIEN